MRDRPTEFLDDIAHCLREPADEPLAARLAALLRQRIEQGELMPGQALPSQRVLAGVLGVGEVTVRKALSALADAGLVSAAPGRGTVITHTPTSRRPTPHTPGGRDRAMRLGIVAVGETDGYPFTQPLLESLERAGGGRTWGRSGGGSGGRVALDTFFLPTPDLSALELSSRFDPASLDGLVMMSPASAPLVAWCQEQRLPYVLLFNEFSDRRSVCVVADYADALFDAVADAQTKGRRRFALVTPQPDRFSARHLVGAFRAALRANGLAFDPRCVVAAGYHATQGASATAELLKQAEPAEVIFFASPHQAQGAVEPTQRHKLRGSADVQLIPITPTPLGDHASWKQGHIELPVATLASIILDALRAQRDPASARALLHTVTCRYVSGK